MNAEKPPASKSKSKKILKYCGMGLGIVALLAGGFVAKNLATWRPMFSDYPMPDGFTASSDPAVIERGKYLVENVAHCGACHAKPDEYLAWKPGLPLPLAGGHEWHMGPLGTIVSVNITPDKETGIGNYTDAELARAIRHGVGKDGRGLLFMMAVGPSSDEDLTAMISYLRTVEPVKRANKETEVGVLGKILFQGPMSFFASPHDHASVLPTYVPQGPASLERGAYLAQGPAACFGCHTGYTVEDGKMKFNLHYGSGGTESFPDETDMDFEFQGPNLSNDPKTGHTKDWTQAQFVKRMKSGRVFKGSPMPWETYAGMTDADLESLWLWMQAIPPTEQVTGPPRREAGWKP